MLFVSGSTTIEFYYELSIKVLYFFFNLAINLFFVSTELAKLKSIDVPNKLTKSLRFRLSRKLIFSFNISANRVFND